MDNSFEIKRIEQESRYNIHAVNEYMKDYCKVYDGSFDTSWRMREHCVKKYSFAIPDPEAIIRISKYSPIVEIGAGSGYWAWLLKFAQADVAAYDDGSREWPKMWTDVQRGGPEKVNSDLRRTLFLCWPEYDTPMAYECLSKYRGKYFIYIGEGPGGCTGDDSFHEYLNKNFNEIDCYKITQWYGIHDRLFFYERKRWS